MDGFTFRRRVAYWECDMQGWVFHAHYFTWMDDAHLEMWKQFVGPYGQFSAQGFEYVIAEANARFRAGARFDEEIEIAIALEPLTQTSLTTLYTIHTGGRKLVDGRVRYVCIRPDGGGKAPWPDFVRNGLAPLVTLAAGTESAPSHGELGSR